MIDDNHPNSDEKNFNSKYKHLKENYYQFKSKEYHSTVHHPLFIKENNSGMCSTGTISTERVCQSSFWDGLVKYDGVEKEMVCCG